MAASKNVTSRHPAFFVNLTGRGTARTLEPAAAFGPTRGDTFEIGASGPWLNRAVPSANPAAGGVDNLTSTRRTAYPGDGTAAAWVIAGVSRLNNALTRMIVT